MFRNWAAICQIADPFLRLALSLLDLASDLGRRVVAQLPEYFSEQETAGPYPWSFIERVGAKQGAKQHMAGSDSFVSLGAIPENVPLQGFDYWGDSEKQTEMGLLPISSDVINDSTPVGQIVNWLGKQFVVVENNSGNDGEIWLAPAECFAMDK